VEEGAATRISVEDAVQAGIQEQQESLRIVRNTTRFATVMCVVIAFTKISIYMITEADVVRTSALDSLGDLMANMITLYTGYRMSQVDPKRYPAGQGKFQSIGCLVFSTLMFALMFGNAISNLEGLVESKDDVGFKAISRFFDQTRTLPEFDAWQSDLICEEAGECIWKGETKIVNPLILYFKENGTADEKLMADSMKDMVTREELVQTISLYENAAEKWAELKMQNFFLGCCASYKCCLWLFCIYYAIPKTGSSVLVALATDKRNDFMCTSFVILVTFAAAYFLKDNQELEDKVDPFVSLLLSFIIMYTWSQLMIEHITLLSQEASPAEFRAGVEAEVRGVVKEDSPCTVDSSDVKVYVSGLGHTVEVTLVAKSDKTSCAELCLMAQVLRKRLMQLEDMERAMVFMEMPQSGA